MTQKHEDAVLDGPSAEVIDMHERICSNKYVCKQLDQIADMIDALKEHMQEQDKHLMEVISQHYKDCYLTPMTTSRKK